MKIITQTEKSLTASKGLPGRLGSAVFLLALGAVLMFVAPLSVAIICWVLAGVFALVAILATDTITVDRPSREIVLRKPSYGLFPKTRIIPFSAVETVQVGYRRTLGLASADWQVTLLLTDHAVNVMHSRNELRMRQLGSAISRLVGVRFVSNTFKPKSVSHDQMRFSRGPGWRPPMMKRSVLVS